MNLANTWPQAIGIEGRKNENVVDIRFAHATDNFGFAESLAERLRRCTHAFVLVPWATYDGIDLLNLNDVFGKKLRRVFLLLSTYLGFNSPDVYERLSSIQTEYADELHVKVFNERMHAKQWLFHNRNETTLLVGSHNLTSTALESPGDISLQVKGGDPFSTIFFDAFDQFAYFWNSHAAIELEEASRLTNELSPPVRQAWRLIENLEPAPADDGEHDESAQHFVIGRPMFHVGQCEYGTRAELDEKAAMLDTQDGNDENEVSYYWWPEKDAPSFFDRAVRGDTFVHFQEEDNGCSIEVMRFRDRCPVVTHDDGSIRAWFYTTVGTIEGLTIFDIDDVFIKRTRYSAQGPNARSHWSSSWELKETQRSALCEGLRHLLRQDRRKYTSTLDDTETSKTWERYRLLLTSEGKFTFAWFDEHVRREFVEQLGDDPEWTALVWFWNDCELTTD